MFDYCPKCQSSKIELKEEQCLMCPECQFTYYHNVAASVAAIIIYQEKILFTIRAKSPGIDLLDLPGGFADANESLEQALTREIKEELGLDIDKWQYFCSQPNTYQYENINYRTLDSIFISEQESLPLCKLQESEVKKINWLAIDTVDFKDVAFQSIEKALKLYML